MDDVRGYIYNVDGKHSGYVVFEGTPKNIANFIMFHQFNRVVITDMLDQFIVSSFGGFLDEVCDSATRKDILDEILPIQYGEVEAFDPSRK